MSNTISRVRACKPKPFTGQPFIELVLESQKGTAERFIKMFEGNANMADLEAEALSMKAAGSISQADLEANWKLDLEEIAAEEAYLEGNALQIFADEMMTSEEEEDRVEPVEPLV